MKRAAEARNSLLHADNAEVHLLVVRCKHRLEATAVVRDADRERVRSEVDGETNERWRSVPGSVVDSLARDHDELVRNWTVNNKLFAANIAVDGNAEFLAELAAHGVDEAGEVLRGFAVVAKLPYGVACLIDGGTHLSTSGLDQHLLERLLICLEARDRFERGGDAGAALQQRVMHLARQPVPFFEHVLKTAADLRDSESMDRKDDGSNQKKTAANEPPCAIEVRALGDAEAGFGDAVGAAHLECHDAERVVAGRNVGVIGNVARTGLVPVLLDAFEPVAEPHCILRPHHDGGVVDLQAAIAGGKGDSTGSRDLASIRDYSGNRNRRQRKPRRTSGRDVNQAAVGWKPDIAARQNRARRLHPAEESCRLRLAGNSIERQREPLDLAVREAIQFMAIEQRDARRTAEPEVSGAVFANIVDAVARQPVGGREVCQAIAAQPIESVVASAKPERALGILVDGPYLVLPHCNHRCVAHEAAVVQMTQPLFSADPQVAGMVFQHGARALVSQSILHAKVGEAVSLKPADPFVSADPHAPVRALQYRADKVVGKAVAIGVVAHGSLGLVEDPAAVGAKPEPAIAILIHIADASAAKFLQSIRPGNPVTNVVEPSRRGP